MAKNTIEVRKDFMKDGADELGHYVFLSIPEFEGTDEEMAFGSECNIYLNGIEYGKTALENGAYQDPWEIEKRDGSCGYYFKEESDADRFAEIIKTHLK